MRSLKLKLASLAANIIWQFKLGRLQVGDQIPVLCYHRVLPELVEGEEPVYSVTPQQFDEQMALLARQGFQSLSLSEYLEIVQGKRALPQRAVLITFDDGYADNYSTAWPIAQRYGLKLNIFICTGLISGRKPVIYERLSPAAQKHQQAWPDLWRSLTWQEIRQMTAGDVEVGFHSHGHVQMSALSKEELRNDLATGLHLCERELGARPRFFALPHGTYESYDERSLALLRASGQELIFTTRLGRTRLNQHGDLVARIVVHQEDRLAAFERKLYGAYDWLGDLRQLNQMLGALRRQPLTKG